MYGRSCAQRTNQLDFFHISNESLKVKKAPLSSWIKYQYLESFNPTQIYRQENHTTIFLDKIYTNCQKGALWLVQIHDEYIKSNISKHILPSYTSKTLFKHQFKLTDPIIYLCFQKEPSIYTHTTIALKINITKNMQPCPPPYKI